ncbi:Sensor histidine kinase RcsC [Pseudomonas fluorescens]|uniref:ATP-binding protein n=1 Tax=Pseudomonas fluorescens TaxID=294 RepID=UPI001250E1D0|nr:ATP-binding protein [Pseudomonas fluorescens]CAG8863760.1 Sensor histidine kinase RcsC [Pseudomonas fluorescens]VVP70141.1 Sensor histidine kinase RcsC [Pseudomonas fluorescens]
MAVSLSLDERALILAPATLGGETSRHLLSAGIGSLHATDILHFEQLLAEGVGVAIIAHESLPANGQTPVHRFIQQQPQWSDVPVLLLGPAPPAAPANDDRSCVEALGNLFRLHSPLDPGQLVHLAESALRARRRQYQARDQEARLQALLHEQNQRLKAEAQALHQTRKMEAIGQLAGGVAHDFNNLLTSIGGSLELIGKRLDRGQTEGLQPLLGLGRDAVGRAARLTHRLLAFSSRQSLASEAIDLNAVLLSQKLTETPDTPVSLDVQMEPGLWYVEADGPQLQVALDNLLHNACEAMPNGGHLQITASNQHIDHDTFADHSLPSGEYLRLSITDDGQGMSQSTLDRAFEPFFTTKPVGQGIGMGLSMVYGFSKQSRGHVILHSEIGRGTRVDLYLPRFHGDAPRPSVAARIVNPSASREVLIVEDDPEVRQIVYQALSEEGYQCSLASDASEALPTLRSTRPVALLISDVGLPGMNGRQLAEIARKLRPNLQILFITGFAETAMARTGFLDPGMQLICKPFELSLLQETVARIIGSPRTPEAKPS